MKTATRTETTTAVDAETRQRSLRFWAPIGLGAAVAGTLTAVLVGTVVSDSDTVREPTPVAPVSTSDREPPTCFQGNRSWRVDLYGEPPCLVVSP